MAFLASDITAVNGRTCSAVETPIWKFRPKTFVPFVDRLNMPASPTAVVWLVVAFIVDSIKRAPRRWAPSHVGYEVLKLAPSFADGYSTATIMAEYRTVWISAALNHRFPYGIFRALPCAMPSGCSQPPFASKATAACRESSSEGIIANNFLTSAIASAKPLRQPLRRMIRKS